MAGDPALQVVIGAAQSSQDIEHQDPIGHRIPEVVKSIGHALHPPAVLTDGEVPLHEGAEGGVELEGAVLGVAEELPLERHPGLPRGAAVCPDVVLKIQDRATLSRRSHVTSRASIGESTRTWSSRA